jgi:basic membrane lipoprotein Med (substrate-binding protein (PBP1-ABC) superfamily)
VWDAAWAFARKQRLWLGGALIVVIALVTWLVWPSGAAAPRAQSGTETAACLLTDDHGVADPKAAAVWSGMRSAAGQTSIRVRYLPVKGAQTSQNAETVLGSFTQSSCVLILAVGTAPVAALPEVAPRFPGIKFVAVGMTTGQADNLSTMDGDEAALKQAAHDAVAAVGRS